jgi:transcriptional regulator with XRE-family HTH domain
VVSFGIKLCRLRLQKGLIQQQLAKAVQCSDGNIRHFEGERQNIPAWKLDSITDFYTKGNKLLPLVMIFVSAKLI